MGNYSRRDFFRTGATIGALAALGGHPVFGQASDRGGGPRVVASGNGLPATEKAMDHLSAGQDVLDAVIAGVNIVENDPEDMSVGYGGLPNEDGVVELDASVMHGPTHNAGAVAALRNIKNPSKIARLIMERTDHVLLVGEGALRFARAHGFPEENLLTERARKAWLRWKETLSDRDNWFPPKSDRLEGSLRDYVMTYGTINCLALDARGDLAGVTTTSGLSYKISGRVGDSPIIGAGLYVDNTIGAAGSTGRGEANILNCGSFSVVRYMGEGLTPEAACVKALEDIVRTTQRQPHLLDEKKRPRFSLNFYALNKKGEFGAATIWSGARFAVHDGKDNRLRESAYLFKRP